MILRAETARELMTPRPLSIDQSAPAGQAAALLTERGVGAAVVIDAAGRPVGVVTKTDLLVHAREHAPGTPDGAVSGLMTPAVFSVREDTQARSVVEQLLALNVHHLFVVDAAGAVVGVVTPTDVLRKLE